MTIRSFTHVLLTALLLVASSTTLAKGRLGFSVQVATNGYFSTTLKQVKVAAVQVGSPAAQAGLRAGDIITELNGQKIEGSKGLELKSRMSNVKTGERLKLAVLRPDGDTVLIEIIAGS